MKLNVSQNLKGEAAAKLRHSLVKDDRHLCGPCQDFLEDGQTDNVCHCGLYHKRVEED